MLIAFLCNDGLRLSELLPNRATEVANAQPIVPTPVYSDRASIEGLCRMTNAVFFIGQRVRHTLFEYRGVIVDVDPCFSLADEWYEHEAMSRPPKDRPWYRVLVHNAIHETYVAERNLEADHSDEPIRHPDIDVHFSGLVDGVYQRRQPGN